MDPEPEARHAWRFYRLAGTSAFYDTLPITRKDPVLWRAEVCPPAVWFCAGVTRLWVTDDQSPSVPGYSGQVTAKGYDNMTGLGVPNGRPSSKPYASSAEPVRSEKIPILIRTDRGFHPQAQHSRLPRQAGTGPPCSRPEPPAL
jgi:hypothetical protein